MTTDDFAGRLQRLEALIQQAERLPDPAARAHTRQIVQALLDLHAAGLERLLDHVADTGDAGRAVFDACAADGVVSGLLLLHGLHPLAVEDRVAGALEKIRPHLRSHGGGVELVGVEGGVVRLRLGGGCQSCPSSSAATRRAIEDAVLASAPDVAAVEFVEEGEAAADAEAGRARVALPLL